MSDSCDPIDGSPPGSPVPVILQARTLEWVAISFSNAWRWKVKAKSLSHVWLFATQWTAAYQAPPSMGFSRQEYWSAGGSKGYVIYYLTLYRKKVCWSVFLMTASPYVQNKSPPSWNSFQWGAMNKYTSKYLYTKYFQYIFRYWKML